MSVVLVLALAALVVDSRLRSALIAYICFTIAALVLAFPHDADVLHRLLFFGLAIIKVIVGPAAILWLSRTHHLRQGLGPSFTLGVRSACVILVLILARQVGQMPAFVGVPSAALVFYSFVTSISVVILHRSLLAHIVGLLALGSAITLAGAVFAPGLPGGVELADTFDALIATLVGVVIARAVAEHDPGLDIRSLRQLRG
jgi:hydrogenase-4 membrane subunit HyfE